MRIERLASGASRDNAQYNARVIEECPLGTLLFLHRTKMIYIKVRDVIWVPGEGQVKTNSSVAFSSLVQDTSLVYPDGDRS